MSDLTQLELKQLHQETDRLEAEKTLKRLERQAKKEAKEKKRKRQLIAKLVAPTLFGLTVLAGLVLYRLSH